MVTPVIVALNSVAAYWSAGSLETFTTFAPAGPAGPCGPAGPAGPAGPSDPSEPPQPAMANAATKAALNRTHDMFTFYLLDRFCRSNWEPAQPGRRHFKLHHYLDTSLPQPVHGVEADCAALPPGSLRRTR